jgi:hypothetical protein
VLKDGGQIGISVWGRRKNSPYFKLLPKIIVEHGIELPPNKSYFHLGESLADVLKEADFKNINQFYRNVYINDPKERVLKSLISSPFYQQTFENVDQQTYKSIISK